MPEEVTTVGKGKGKSKPPAPPAQLRSGRVPKAASVQPTRPASKTLQEQLSSQKKALAPTETVVKGQTPSVPEPVFQMYGSDAATLNILAFGASNTAGYHGGTDPWTPYGEAMSMELTTSGMHAAVWVCGHSSRTAQWSASDEIMHSPLGLKWLLDEKGPFSLALIQIGSNDLPNKDMSAEDIAENICHLHRTCHSEGVATIALEMVESKALVQGTKWERPDLRQKWEKTNCIVRDWAASLESYPGCTYVEVTKLIPYCSREPSENDDGRDDSSWDEDGIHFSPHGSDKLGKSLASIVERLMKS